MILEKQHHYQLTTTWTGNTGKGTGNYRSYERSLTVSVENKADILATSDTAFNSDKTLHNPEGMLLAAISSCHMLWYLHLCAVSGITVQTYVDNATATMVETEDGGGHFSEVNLFPAIIISEASMVLQARELHRKANQLCYIANSCNFPIHHHPEIESR